MGNEYFYADDSIGMIGGAEASAVGFAGVFVLIYGLIMLFALAYSITTYVLYSLGLYTIAQRRRIRNPWLAWIPVGNIWMLGSISDQYQYVAKGKVKSRRKIMIGLSILAAAFWLVWLILTVLGAVTGVGGAATVLLMMFGLLAFFGIVIALAVLEYMCYYDLYRSCDPDNDTLFLVLSVVFSAAIPFFVFACRKKDRGMPVRKQPAPVEVIPAETAEPQETKEETAETIEETTEGEPVDEQEIPVADA